MQFTIPEYGLIQSYPDVSGSYQKDSVSMPIIV